MPPDIQLTAEQRKKLVTASDRIVWAQRQLDRLAAAGIDVSAHQADVDAAEKLRQGMLAALGPTQQT